MTSGMDPHMVRDFAQDMSRALATAEATLSAYAEKERAIRHIIADMKSNHGTHADYIKRIEQTLDGEA